MYRTTGRKYPAGKRKWRETCRSGKEKNKNQLRIKKGLL